MPAAHVQTVSNEALSVNTLGITLTLTAGNAVILTLMADTSLGGLTGGGALTPPGGTAFTFENAVNPYSAQFAVFGVSAGSTTYTFNWTNNQNVRLFATEVSGLTASGFDQSAVASVTSATTHATGTTGTLAQADEIAIAIFNADGSGSTTLTGVSNSFTIPTNGDQITGVGAAGPIGATAYLVTAATTGVTTTFTDTNGTLGAAMIGTYMATAAAVGTPFFMQLGAQRI